jgi:spatacsin
VLAFALIIAGESNSSGCESGNDYDNHILGSPTLSSHEFDRPSGSSLVNDLPCTSGSGIGIDTNVAEIKCSRSNSHPFISDVNSLAWARCGDSYDQHNDTSFREFLFVSGRCGVTVHAFPKLTKARKIVQSALEGSYRQGRWVEWGPIPAAVQNMEVGESSSLSHDVSGSQNVNWNGGDDGGVEFLRGSALTKRHLKSFFTKVETIVTDGSVWTKFPENNEFPCSTEVVSFNIFDGSISLEYILNEKSVQSMENRQEPADLVEDADHSSLSLGTEGIKSDCFSNVFGIEINGFYECHKIFSSASHCLVGFFLTLMHDVSGNISGPNQRGRNKNLLLVAKLDNWGIQWVSVVKLDEKTNTVQEVEWMDFQFCDNLLVCLESSGLIVLYSAISGEFVTHLNVSQACGLNPLLNFHGSAIKDNLYVQHRDSLRRSFKRLVVASHTYFLAVVDACGVIYVISLSEYVTEKSYISKKLLPYCQQFGLGLLVGWGAGGSDIDCQAAFSNFSGYFQSNDLNIKNRTVSYPDKDVEGDAFQKSDGYTSKERHNLFGPNSSGFSQATNDHKFIGSDVKSPVMKKIFLPNFKLCEDDSISFSPMGITILSKMKNVKNQKGSKLVHFNLQVKLDAHDDNLLDSAYDVYHFNGKEEAVIGEVVGCTFQGCFYIVREDGLSAYIPSVSLLSSYLPVEYIGYRQPSRDRGISVLLKDNVEVREPTKRFSPWKLEILDRVLVYEGIEEADQLCSRNGELKKMIFIYIIPLIIG